MNQTSPGMLSIRLNVDEGKLVLEALAECPFKYVYELIGKLNRQANEGYTGTSAQQEFAFTASELALTIKALGELPFSRVHALVDKLNQHMLRQSSEYTKVPLHHVET